jgi:hypothetical protein
VFDGRSHVGGRRVADEDFGPGVTNFASQAIGFGILPRADDAENTIHAPREKGLDDESDDGLVSVSQGEGQLGASHADA